MREAQLDDLRQQEQTDTLVSEVDPVDRSAEDQPAVPHDTRHGRMPGPGVLVVDDDRAISLLLNRLSCEFGFVVWLTSSGYRALQVYQGHRQDIDFVLIDVHMPGLDGPQTLTALRKLNPLLRSCFVSGDIDPYTEQDLFDRGAERILYKPFRLADVTEVLQEWVNSYRKA